MAENPKQIARVEINGTPAMSILRVHSNIDSIKVILNLKGITTRKDSA